jgi:hypothetical protein
MMDFGLRRFQVSRDERIDRGITWGLTTMAGLAFAVGAWQFTGLVNEVHHLRDTMESIRTQIAVVESQKLGDRVRELEHRMDLVESRGK